MSEAVTSLVARVEARTIKALSIRQPWCHHILYDGKDVENRDWPTNGRGWVLMHASKSEAEDRELIREKKMPLGGIVGAIKITDCVSRSDSPWFVGDYGFVISERVEIPLIPCAGRLGFFSLPDDVLNAVLAALQAGER